MDSCKCFPLCAATIISITMAPPFTSRRHCMSEAARSSQREPTKTCAMEHISQLGTDANDGLVPHGLQELRRSIRARSDAVVAATTDPFVYSLPVSGCQLWAALPG